MKTINKEQLFDRNNESIYTPVKLYSDVSFSISYILFGVHMIYQVELE